MRRELLVLFILGSCLQLPAFAQQPVQWGSAEKPAMRQSIEGMKTYYEPDKVEQNGGVHSFTLYRSIRPTPSDEVGRYMINCETRELVSIVGGKATAPARILAGEEMYPVGKKLCEWDQKSFFKKLLD